MDPSDVLAILQRELPAFPDPDMLNFMSTIFEDDSADLITDLVGCVIRMRDRSQARCH